jgi:hypothetical protein
MARVGIAAKTKTRLLSDDPLPGLDTFPLDVLALRFQELMA